MNGGLLMFGSTNTNSTIKTIWKEKALLMNTSSFVFMLTLLVYSLQLTCLAIFVGQLFKKGLLLNYSK
jgi:hypothetical protein